MRQTQRSCNFLQRLRTRGTDGSAAMEFAFVAPIFFTLMLGILQLGIMIFGQFALQNAVTQAARLIRTGQAQSINTAAQGATSSSQSSSSTAMTPSQLTSMLVNQIMSTMSGGGSDAMLSAMSGSSTSSSSSGDPLLDAMSGSTSSTSTTSSDPLLQAMSSGVNIVV